MSASSERVRQLLQRERSFSSHVSHQLRTPVAAMRVAVETELDAPRPDPTEVLRECLRELDRLERTVTSLLALARHDERQPEWCDVAALVRAQAERWRAPYAAAGRDRRLPGHLGVGGRRHGRRDPHRRRAARQRPDPRPRHRHGRDRVDAAADPGRRRRRGDAARRRGPVLGPAHRDQARDRAPPRPHARRVRRAASSGSSSARRRCSGWSCRTPATPFTGRSPDVHSALITDRARWHRERPTPQPRRADRGRRDRHRRGRPADGRRDRRPPVSP